MWYGNAEKGHEMKAHMILRMVRPTPLSKRRNHPTSVPGPHALLLEYTQEPPHISSFCPHALLLLTRRSRNQCLESIYKERNEVSQLGTTSISRPYEGRPKTWGLQDDLGSNAVRTLVDPDSHARSSSLSSDSRQSWRCRLLSFSNDACDLVVECRWTTFGSWESGRLPDCWSLLWYMRRR